MSDRSPAVRWVLVLSLALNVALGAALLLPWLAPDRYSHRGGHDRHGHAMEHMPSPRHLRRLLGEERGAVVDEVTDRHREAIRATFGPLREARRNAHEAMHAEPFDPAALQRAFDELRVRDAETTAAIQAMVANLVAALTPQERELLAEAAEQRRAERRERYRERRRGKGDDDDGRHGAGEQRARGESDERPRGEGDQRPRGEGDQRPRGEGDQRPRGEGDQRPRGEGDGRRQDESGERRREGDDGDSDSDSDDREVQEI